MLYLLSLQIVFPVSFHYSHCICRWRETILLNSFTRHPFEIIQVTGQMVPASVFPACESSDESLPPALPDVIDSRVGGRGNFWFLWLLLFYRPEVSNGVGGWSHLRGIQKNRFSVPITVRLDWKFQQPVKRKEEAMILPRYTLFKFLCTHYWHFNKNILKPFKEYDNNFDNLIHHVNNQYFTCFVFLQLKFYISEYS